MAMGTAFLALFEVTLILFLAFVWVLCLPFVSLWAWLTQPRKRPPKGFWNTP